MGANKRPLLKMTSFWWPECSREPPGAPKISPRELRNPSGHPLGVLCGTGSVPIPRFLVFLSYSNHKTIKSYPMGRRAAPPGEVTLSLVEPLDLLPLHAPARRTSGVGGFQGPAAPCRRPQGTTPKRTKLNRTQATTALQRATRGRSQTTTTELSR